MRRVSFAGSRVAFTSRNLYITSEDFNITLVCSVLAPHDVTVMHKINQKQELSINLAFNYPS